MLSYCRPARYLCARSKPRCHLWQSILKKSMSCHVTISFIDPFTIVTMPETLRSALLERLKDRRKGGWHKLLLRLRSRIPTGFHPLARGWPATRDYPGSSANRWEVWAARQRRPTTILVGQAAALPILIPHAPILKSFPSAAVTL